MNKLIFFCMLLLFSTSVLADELATPSEVVSGPDLSDGRLVYDGPAFDSSSGAARVDSVSIGAPAAELFALPSQPLDANVVVYDGTFDGRDISLVVPYSNFGQLDVINGQLINVSNSNVVGRFLEVGQTFDPTDYTYSSYTMGSVYGSSNNIYRYGSANFERSYYVNDRGSISYDDKYGAFYVTDYHVYYSTQERQYYALLILILLLGGIYTCFRRLKL